jgi:transcriptional antiterminator NusG
MSPEPEQRRRGRGGRLEPLEPAGTAAEGEESESQGRRNLRWYAVQVASGCENKSKAP